MSRAALQKTVTSVAIVIAALGFGGWAYIANLPSHKVVITNSQHQVIQLSYHGQAGQTALALLRKHAVVQTKHYSFGDMITSIDGSKGTGPKYWTFYVNGKEASVGAGSYITKNADMLAWKLQ